METSSSEFVRRIIAPTVVASGAMFRVTSVTDANNFESTDLVEFFATLGLGDSVFASGGWRVRCEWDSGGSGSAPQGESRLITGSDVSAGQITHSAFSANLAEGDFVTLIPPEKAETMLIRGGNYSLFDLMRRFDEQLDVARSPQSIEFTCDGNENTIYEPEVTGHVRAFHGATITFPAGTNAGSGEDTQFKIHVKTSPAGTYHEIWWSPAPGPGAYLHNEVPTPPVICIPNTDVGQYMFIPYYNVYGFKITEKQNAVGAGWNTLTLEVFDSMRGG